MTDGETIRITPGLAVPRSELVLKATRSGGPGGQHVNTSATRVELAWDIVASPSLTDEQRALLLESLASRLHGGGVLRMTEGRRRSQHQNREALLERFATTIARALERPEPRRPTRPPRAAKEARLREKKERAERKRRRAPPMPDE